MVLFAPPVAEAEMGSVEFQVKGTPTRLMPRMSVTVALRVVEVPVLTKKEVVGLFRALMEMDWMGQVSNGTGWLWIPPTLVKKRLSPGVLAVAISWFKGDPTGGELRVTALVVCPARRTVCQAKGPTELVMSVVPLRANAW